MSVAEERKWTMWIAVAVLCMALLVPPFLTANHSSYISSNSPKAESESKFLRWDISNTMLYNASLPRKSKLFSKSIAFLKTHKTGSSTAIGILWRYLCLSQGRHCFLPPEEHPGRTFNPKDKRHWSFMTKESAGTQYLFCAKHQRRSDTNCSQVRSGAPYDVWLSHVRFHPKLWQLLTSQIQPMTIVRSPGHRFQSAWHWYEIDAALQSASPPSPTSQNRHKHTLHDLVSEIIQWRRNSNFTDSSADNNHQNSILNTSVHLERQAVNIYAHLQAEHTTNALSPAQYPVLHALYHRYMTKDRRVRSGMDSMSQELTGLSLMSTPLEVFDAEFAQLLKAIESRFLFVMVLERFEESLLCLHYLLHASNTSTTSAASVLTPDSGIESVAYLFFLRQKTQEYADHQRWKPSSTDMFSKEDASTRSTDSTGSTTHHILSSSTTDAKPTTISLNASTPAPSSSSLSLAELQVVHAWQPYDTQLYDTANRALSQFLGELYPDTHLLTKTVNWLKGILGNVDASCSSSASTLHEQDQHQRFKSQKEREDWRDVDSRQLVNCTLLQRDNREAIQLFYQGIA